MRLGLSDAKEMRSLLEKYLLRRHVMPTNANPRSKENR